MWSGTLTAVNGYDSNVTLPALRANLERAQYRPTRSFPPRGRCGLHSHGRQRDRRNLNFSIQGTDGTITQSQSVSLAVNGTFTVPGTLTNPTSASPGQTTTTSMQLTPVGGTTFTSSVSYSCSGLPAGATCSFSPASPLLGRLGNRCDDYRQYRLARSPARQVAHTPGTRRIAQNQNPRLWLPLTLPLAGVVLVGLGGGKISRRYKIVGLCLMLVLTGLMVACGGGRGTPPAPVAVSVSPAVNTLCPNLSGAPAQTQQFSATVTGTSTRLSRGPSVRAEQRTQSVHQACIPLQPRFLPGR